MAEIITKAQFVEEQNEYRNIQKQGILKLKKTDLPNNAHRFYLDSTEESFVFEKNLVLYLLAHPDAKYLRVYYGAIPKAYEKDDKPEGTPTIILSAAKRNSPYSDVGEIYIEWPTGLNANGE